MRFIDEAAENFAHLLMVAGNHEHYDGIFDETAGLLKRNLPAVTVLDNESVEIAGVRFLGTTLWSDFEGRSVVAMDRVRKRMGEYFFVKTRVPGGDTLKKFQPEDALAAHDVSLTWLRSQFCNGYERTVVISHHAPSLSGCNPRHAGNGLDGAYASPLDGFIASLERVPVWVHGHTHIARTYRIGNTLMSVNCRGFDNKDVSARRFSPTASFEI